MIEIISFLYNFRYTSVNVTLIILCLSSIIIHNTVAIIPRECFKNATKNTGTCCPIPIGFKEPCGGIGRGICDHLTIHIETVHSAFSQDDRINWPNRFFTKVCRCEGNFFGVACDQCWYGWKGQNCDQRHISLRRNIKSLTNDERMKFMKLFEITNRKPSPFMVLIESNSDNSDPLINPRFIPATFQQSMAFIHNYASRSTLFRSKLMCDYYGILDYNHNAVSFGLWHRSLMLMWERQFSELAEMMYGWKEFGIPYWDWLDVKECEVCNNDLVGSTGLYDDKLNIWRLDRKSRFYDWTEYCAPPLDPNIRCYGCHFRKKFQPLNRRYKANKFPTTEDLVFVLRHSTWYLPDEKINQDENCRSFHIALEGFCGRPEDKNNSRYLFMHNRIHNMVDGSMCCASTAANDPLFILHHSSIDRIIECWFSIYSPTLTQLPNHGTEPGNCRECNMVGMFPPIRNSQVFVKMAELGVKYDNFVFGRKGFDCLRDGPKLISHKI